MKGLESLMYSDRRDPGRVECFLKLRFPLVVNEHLPGQYDRQISCYAGGRRRLRVQYRWVPRVGVWQFQPMPGKRA